MRDRIELWRDVKVNEAGSWYVLPSLLQSSLVDDPILTICTRQVNGTFPSTPSVPAPFYHAASLSSTPTVIMHEPYALHVDQRYRSLSFSTVRTLNSLLSLC